MNPRTIGVVVDIHLSLSKVEQLAPVNVPNTEYPIFLLVVKVIE